MMNGGRVMCPPPNLQEIYVVEINIRHLRPDDAEAANKSSTPVALLIAKQWLAQSA